MKNDTGKAPAPRQSAYPSDGAAGGAGRCSSTGWGPAGCPWGGGDAAGILCATGWGGQCRSPHAFPVPGISWGCSSHKGKQGCRKISRARGSGRWRTEFWLPSLGRRAMGTWGQRVRRGHPSAATAAGGGGATFIHPGLSPVSSFPNQLFLINLKHLSMSHTGSSGESGVRREVECTDI